MLLIHWLALVPQAEHYPYYKKNPAAHPNPAFEAADEQAYTLLAYPEQAVQTPADKKYPALQLVATGTVQVAAPVGQATQIPLYSWNPVLQVKATVKEEQVAAPAPQRAGTPAAVKKYPLAGVVETGLAVEVVPADTATQTIPYK